MKNFRKIILCIPLWMEKSRHSLFELGCGLGVPGMIASLRGATTVLSEQERLLDQLRRNIHCDCVFEPLYGKSFYKISVWGSCKQYTEIWIRKYKITINYIFPAYMILWSLSFYQLLMCWSNNLLKEIILCYAPMWNRTTHRPSKAWCFIWYENSNLV